MMNGLPLGLSAASMDRHIAWDIGAAGVSDRLAKALNAPVIRQRYSRLVIDCNRDPSRADAMPAVSDRTSIPANVDLSQADRDARIADIHVPYHEAITAELDAQAAAGRAPSLVLVHSFTPRMNDIDRPWTCGVLHHGESALSHAMLARLQGEAGQVVGDNEPYAFDSIDYTAPRHALARGLDYVELELRQDLIAHEDGQIEWAERLARLIPLAAADVARSALA